MRWLLIGLGLVTLQSNALAQVLSLPAPTTNRSITITAGNVFQTILAAVGGYPAVQRASLTIQNNNASDSCWIYLGSGVANKANSIFLQAGWPYTRYFPYVPNDAVQATCVNTGDTLYVDTQ